MPPRLVATVNANRAAHPSTFYKPRPIAPPAMPVPDPSASDLLDKALDPDALTVEEILQLQADHVAECVMTYFDEPLVLTRGEAATLAGPEGEFLDFYSGVAVANAGHCHPTIVEAIKAQLDRLWHTSTLYPTAPMALFAKALADATPGPLSRSFFVNSGSEAVEAGLHMAKIHAQTHWVATMTRSFHGRTYMAMSATNQGTWRQNMEYAGGVIVAPVPYRYRPPKGVEPDDVAGWAADVLEELLDSQTPGRLAAFIGEPVLGNGGVIVPPDDYFRRVKRIVEDRGGLFISDEVQAGFGRTGTMWAIEPSGVQPDLMTMAKGIASGFPLGAAVTTDEVSASLKPKDLFSTYGGNPLAMVAGLANLKVVQEEGLVERARRMGQRLMKGLEEIVAAHDVAGEARGRGLMTGIEVVEDKDTKEPAPGVLADVKEEARRRGLLVGSGGLEGNVLRVKPPLVVGEEQVDEGIRRLDEAFGAAATA